MNIKRHLYTILAATSVLITSCGDDETLTPYVPDEDKPFSYRINGLKDTSMERIGEARYLILVEKLTGKSENVVLSGGDLPEGMEIKYDPVNGEKPSFNTMVVVKSTRVKEGVYRINLKGASATSGISNNYVNVTIKPYSNAAIGQEGEFMETGQCTPSGALNHNVNVVADALVKNKIIIKGLYSGVMTNQVYAELNPANKTLTIPKQKQNFVDFQGEGTYDDDKLIINYTVTGVAVNETCTATLIRK